LVFSSGSRHRHHQAIVWMRPDKGLTTASR